jgi:hypothetical protein
LSPADWAGFVVSLMVGSALAGAAMADIINYLERRKEEDSE